MNRLGKIVGGLGNSVQALPGLAKDLALSAFTDDDEYDGFVNSVYQHTKGRLGQMAGSAMGPQSGLGAAFGAVPEAFRAPVRSVTEPVLHGMETLGREAIREPLSALVSAASLSQAGEGFDLREGYRIAQHRSLGQAVALAFLTDDITDETEVAKAMGTDWYENISGTMDLAARLFLEPDVLVGEVTKIARFSGAGSKVTKALEAIPGARNLVARGVFGRVIRTNADREAILVHPGWQATKERIGQIRREAGVDVEVSGLPEVAPVDEALRLRHADLEARLGAAPPAPQVTIVNDLLEPAAPGLPPLFHGTKAPIPGGALDDTLMYDSQAGNLFGSGLYTTASEDVASTYQRKGAKLAKATDEPTVYGVRWKGKAPPKVLDLDQPIVAPVAKKFTDLVDNLRSMENVSVEEVAGFKTAIGAGVPTTEIYSLFRGLLEEAGITRGAADEIITDLNQGIRDDFGIDAFKHVGGGYAGKGKGPPHDVFIWLDQRNVEIAERSRGPSRQALGNYQRAVAEHGTLSDEAVQARQALEADEARFGAETAKREERLARQREKVTKQREVGVERASAKIRDLMFHDHASGGVNGRVLAEADDLDEAMRAMTGDKAAWDSLLEKQADIAGQISRNRGRQSQLATYRRTRVGDQLGLPFELERAELAELNPELEQLYGVQERVQRMKDSYLTVAEVPRITALSEQRHRIGRSQFFQKSPFAAPLRLASTMRPHGMVNLHDATGDIQVARYTKKAGLALEEQDRLRGAYMAAADPTARNLVLAEMESTSIRGLAEKHGIEPGDVDRIVEEARLSSDRAMQSIRSASKYDAEGKFHLIDHVDEDGVATKIHVPGAVTQEFQYHALPDLDSLDRVFSKYSEIDKRFGKGKAVAGVAAGRLADLGDDFYKIWKPSVLIRAGWPFRVVGEEQLRLMAKIGALTTVKQTGSAAGRYLKDALGQGIQEISDRIKRIPVEQRLSEDLQTAVVRGQRIGTMEVRNWEMQHAFGTHGDVQDVIHGLNSSRSSFQAVISTERELLEDMGRQATNEWRSIPADDISHPSAWTHAVNNQIGKDVLWRRFMEGWSVEQAEDWLFNTTEGQQYGQRMKHWRGKESQWLTAMKDIADDYAPTDEIRRLALDGKATYSDLERAVPDVTERPVVHGAILQQVQGKGFLREQLTKLRDKSMRALGQMPTDVLSRHPFFDFMYTEEINRTVGILADQGVEFSADLAVNLEKKARQFALNESKKLLYDLAEQSEMGHMLRFLSPFYGAWQEVLTRWTGLAVENPAFVARAHQAWQAPERAGWVVDENGHRVDENGQAVDDQGNKVEVGTDRFISMSLPQSAIDNLSKVPGLEGIKTQAGVRMNKQGFNLVLQGAPGFGPLVQIPVNEIVKGRPELEDSMKWALPFGTTQDTMDMILPATAKRLKTRAAGEEDRVYRNTLMRIYFDGIVDQNLGKRETQPTYEEAKKKADAFYNMRAVASFISPVAPQFFSPYQIQIDAYRALKAADEGKDRNAPGYKDPDTIFLETYGEEFFVLTQSLSKSVDGVPPTLEGHEARRKYQDLIERNPDLGGLIIGADGAGEFNRAVYDSQLSKKVAPGSEKFQREGMSFEEASKAPNVRLGWMEYSKAMDLIEAERIQRGLPNLQVKAARDLADLKRQITDGIARQYPEWFEQFSTVDRNKWDRRLAGMREIAADDRLAGRDDIAGLRDYLQVRDAVVAELSARKAAGQPGKLDASDNRDLNGIWEQIKSAILEQNLAFSSLYWRWLGNDALEGEAV